MDDAFVCANLADWFGRFDSLPTAPRPPIGDAVGDQENVNPRMMPAFATRGRIANLPAGALLGWNAGRRTSSGAVRLPQLAGSGLDATWP